MTLDEFLKLPGANQWHGGDMPVSGGTRVVVMQRSGHVRHARQASHWSTRANDVQWGRDCWKHDPDPELAWEDIIAYREVQP